MSVVHPAGPETQHFWDRCARGELLYQQCRQCGRVQSYPRFACHHCHVRALEWRQSSGRGRVLSFTVVHRAPSPRFRGDVPYVLAIVEMEEGFRLMSRIVTMDPDRIALDAPIVMDCAAGALPVARMA